MLEKLGDDIKLVQRLFNDKCKAMGVCFDGDECGGKGVGNVAVYVQGRSQTFQNEGGQVVKGDLPGLKMAALHRPLYKVSFHLRGSREAGLLTELRPCLCLNMGWGVSGNRCFCDV